MEKSDLIKELRKEIPAKIAKELVSVQPMDEAGEALGILYKFLKDNPTMSLEIVLWPPVQSSD